MKSTSHLLALILIAAAITLNPLPTEIHCSDSEMQIPRRGTIAPPQCINYLDFGMEIIPQPGKPIVVSVRFLEKMDVSSKLSGELTIPGSPAIFLQDGAWEDDGLAWQFVPIKLGPSQGTGKLLLGGARTSDSLLMMQKTFPVCVGTKPLLDRLRGIAEWAIAYPASVTYHGAIFVEGYYMRTLLGLYEITGEQRYLDLVRKSSGKLLDAQRPEGYWGTGYGAIYFADTGSALGQLINFYKYAAVAERKRIDTALQRYVDLLLVKGDSQGRPFVHQDGSVGVGYHLDKDGKITEEYNKPYTISTALTGAQIFAAMYYLTGNEGHKQIAVKACDWLLDTMAPSGQIPYYIDDWNPDREEKWCWQKWPYDTSTYAGEGFIAAWTYIDDEIFRRRLAERVKPHIEWLLHTQNYDGSWGKRGEVARTDLLDLQRSHGVVNLLLWYYCDIERDPRIARAIRKYYMLLLDEERCRYLNVPGGYGISASIASRALVSIIMPGVDCYRWKQQ